MNVFARIGKKFIVMVVIIIKLMSEWGRKITSVPALQSYMCEEVSFVLTSELSLPLATFLQAVDLTAMLYRVDWCNTRLTPAFEKKVICVI